MAIAVQELPRWDLESVFPSVESAEYRSVVDRMKRQIADLGAELDRVGIGATPGAGSAAAFPAVLRSYNDLIEHASTVMAYTYCTVDTDSRNEVAQAKVSELDQALVPLMKLESKIVSWLGTQNPAELTAASPEGEAHAYFIRKAHERATRLMSPAEEELAADLAPTGSTAWAKLHSDMSSQIEVDVQGEKLPMSAVRNLAYDADRSKRRAAYEAELGAWKTWELPLSACMNGVKGEVSVLCRKRNWDSPLNEALFHSNIDRGTLDAMMAAAQDSMPTFRRYLHAKARLLGVAKLEWYDIFAPVGDSPREWAWGEACDFVADCFDSYSPKMGDFARRNYTSRWIDAGPRPGKRDGAYCSDMREDESRILMNFKPAFGSVKTLAHELGHAYHNLCLHGRTPIQKTNPMTLAETASTFCETIVAHAGLKEASGGERLSILEATLQGQCQVVVDITSRFLFEQAVFTGRESRELSANELSAAMEDAQKKTYGDGLASLHPYMWAAKPHYYSTGSYYNYPYMFGLLFGLGLYACYEKDPDGFRTAYDDLLSSTGMDDAATLAAKFGIDVRSKAFWAGSLGVIARDIEQFEALCP